MDAWVRLLHRDEAGIPTLPDSIAWQSPALRKSHPLSGLPQLIASAERLNSQHRKSNRKLTGT